MSTKKKIRKCFNRPDLEIISEEEWKKMGSFDKGNSRFGGQIVSVRIKEETVYYEIQKRPLGCSGCERRGSCPASPFINKPEV